MFSLLKIINKNDIACSNPRNTKQKLMKNQIDEINKYCTETSAVN